MNDELKSFELDDDELDESWINEIEEEDKLYNSFYKEPNEIIKIFYIYIDNTNKIYYIKKSHIELDNSILKKLSLIYLLKKHRYHNNKIHNIISILQYNINLDPQDLGLYLKKEENYNFLSSKSNIMEIKWDDTINLFKDLNTLYIIFHESNKKKKNNNTKKILIELKKKKLKRHTTTKKKT